MDYKQAIKWVEDAVADGWHGEGELSPGKTLKLFRAGWAAHISLSTYDLAQVTAVAPDGMPVVVVDQSMPEPTKYSRARLEVNLQRCYWCDKLKPDETMYRGRGNQRLCGGCHDAQLGLNKDEL